MSKSCAFRSLSLYLHWLVEVGSLTPLSQHIGCDNGEYQVGCTPMVASYALVRVTPGHGVGPCDTFYTIGVSAAENRRRLGDTAYESCSCTYSSIAWGQQKAASRGSREGRHLTRHVSGRSAHFHDGYGTPARSTPCWGPVSAWPGCTTSACARTAG